MHQLVRVKYEGDINGIDANTLLPSLLGFVAAVQQVNDHLKTGAKLKVYVQATDTGSFLVDFNIILDLTQKLINFLEPNTPLDKVLYAVTALIMLKIFLGRQEPKEIQEEDKEVKIINVYGDHVTIAKEVYNIATRSEVVDRALSQMFESPCEDESVCTVSDKSREKRC